MIVLLTGESGCGKTALCARRRVTQGAWIERGGRVDVATLGEWCKNRNGG